MIKLCRNLLTAQLHGKVRKNPEIVQGIIYKTSRWHISFNRFC